MDRSLLRSPVLRDKLQPLPRLLLLAPRDRLRLRPLVRSKAEEVLLLFPAGSRLVEVVGTPILLRNQARARAKALRFQISSQVLKQPPRTKLVQPRVKARLKKEPPRPERLLRVVKLPKQEKPPRQARRQPQLPVLLQPLQQCL